MLTHARKRALRAALSVAVVTGAVAGASSAQAATAQPTAAQLDPAFAAQPIKAGYVRKGNDFIYEGGAVIISPASGATSLPCPDPYVCFYRDLPLPLGARTRIRDGRLERRGIVGLAVGP